MERRALEPPRDPPPPRGEAGPGPGHARVSQAGAFGGRGFPRPREPPLPGAPPGTFRPPRRAAPRPSPAPPRRQHILSRPQPAPAPRRGRVRPPTPDPRPPTPDPRPPLTCLRPPSAAAPRRAARGAAGVCPPAPAPAAGTPPPSWSPGRCRGGRRAGSRPDALSSLARSPP